MSVDFEKKIADFQKASDGSTVQHPYDLLIGCDGSNSIVWTLLALDVNSGFRVRTVDDDMEYQVAVLRESFQDMCNESEAASIPVGTVHSWNDRPANSLCLAFPHEEGGLLFTIIFPDGKLEEFKEQDSYDAVLASLLPDVTLEAQSEIIQQLKKDGGGPSTGGTCVFPSFLGSAKHGVVLVGDSGHGMFPSLGQGANCALESAAVFSNTLDDVSVNVDNWPEPLVVEYNTRCYDDAQSAVALTYQGMGGTKKRHANNASILFMAQIGTIMLLHKITFGLVPKPAMLRLMFGEDESYSSIARDHFIYEKQKALLFGLALALPIANFIYTKFFA